MRDEYSLESKGDLYSGKADRFRYFDKIDKNRSLGVSGIGRGYAIPLELNLPYEKGSLEERTNNTHL